LKGALVALLFVARATQSQTIESSVDAGAMALRYADTVSTGAAVVSPRLIIGWGSGFADAAATLSQFTTGGWSAQGILSASRFFPTSRAFYAELAGLAGGSTHNDGTRTGEIVANGRLHFPLGRTELFFGAGGGRTWDGIGWRSLLLTEAGASIGSAARNALLTVSPTVVNDSIHYTDLQTSLSWTTSRADLGALIGIRFGDQLTTLSENEKSWASVSAVGHINRRFAVALSGGSYPIDPTQGFPGGRFLAVALRIKTGGRGRALAATQQIEAPGTAGEAVVSSFSATRNPQGTVTFTVTAPGAERVEISGDFTNWTPLLMAASPAGPGQWVAHLPVAPGNYQMNLRVNGGRWVAPPGTLSMLDEFGGTVGLLVVQ
jgi:hypothetical protein